MDKPADWTTGQEAILYQLCESCHHPQYFRRGICAACGSTELLEKRASGKGTVYATSVVMRAASHFHDRLFLQLQLKPANRRDTHRTIFHAHVIAAFTRLPCRHQEAHGLGDEEAG